MARLTIIHRILNLRYPAFAFIIAMFAGVTPDALAQSSPVPLLSNKGVAARMAAHSRIVANYDATVAAKRRAEIQRAGTKPTAFMIITKDHQGVSLGGYVLRITVKDSDTTE